MSDGERSWMVLVFGPYACDRCGLNQRECREAERGCCPYCTHCPDCRAGARVLPSGEVVQQLCPTCGGTGTLADPTTHP